MRYLPYGGHAPGHEAFCAQLECVVAGDELSLDDRLPEVAEVFWDEQPCTVRWLFGQLWKCTDVLPGMWRNEIEDLANRPTTGTYAAAARVMQCNVVPDAERIIDQLAV